MITESNKRESRSARLENCYTGAVFDVLRGLGYPDQVLPSGIRPLEVQQRIAAPVYTVEGRRDDSLTEHDSLLQWCTMLSKIPAGHAVVCQPNDRTVAHMGELSAETLVYRNVKGYIVAGGCRDVAQVVKTGLPVFCEYFTPVDVVGKWKPTAFGEAIRIGQVTVRTGDYVLADRDGVIIIPEEVAETVIEKTEAVLKQENLVRKAILQGADPVDAYLKYGKF